MSERVVRNHPSITPTAGSFAREGRRGFTLIELLVVIVIIGIILSLVMLAASDAARRAEERATQALITKLEGGLNDRIDALMQSRPDPNWAHGYMAAVWNNTYAATANLASQYRTTDRAQVFAWYDYIKREIPDVFFIQNDPNYPINFAAQSFPGTANPLMTPNGGYANYVLPLGNTITGGNPTLTTYPGGYGDFNTTNPTLGFTGLGIYGASYPAAAGLFKNLLNAQPNGYDGVDNSNPPNNLIDEITEGNWSLAVLQTNHTHATARSEVLYAILVEGAGPWGTVFNRDDFTDREVADTDGDGLPEFIDAWGQPLQFFRWPILYHSDLQRGQTILASPSTPNTWDLVPPYQNFLSANSGTNASAGAPFLERERDTLDPNQQLTAPQWWSQTGVGGQLATNNGSPFANLTPSPAGSLNASGGVQAFEYFFHRLTEPLPNGAGPTFWDRGGTYPRRAYYSKFLILSGGRDKQPGVFLYSDADMATLGNNAAFFLIANENCALPFGLDMLGGGTVGFTSAATLPILQSDPAFPGLPAFTPSLPSPSGDVTHPSTYDLQQSAKDDISNHNLQSVSGIGGSG